MNDILDIEIILKKQNYGFIYDIGFSLIVILLIFLYVSFVYEYKSYYISKGTIKTWIRKSKHLELASGLKQGRPRKDEIIDYKERYEILKKYQAFIEARHNTK